MIGVLQLNIKPDIIRKELVQDCVIIPFPKLTNAKEIVDYYKEIEETEYLIICDSKIFKTLAKVNKSETYLGTALPCHYGKHKLIYCVNPNTIYTNPETIRSKIRLALSAMTNTITVKTTYEAYPSTYEEIATALQMLRLMNRPLTVDIETFSLKHHNCGIATIAFAWTKEQGIAFAVDYNGFNFAVRKLLLNFFSTFKPTCIYHNAGFDVKALIYQLFMDTLVDTEGLLNGLETLTNRFEDTKLIAYVATNTCAENNLSLKHLALEFTGNYAEDVKDVRKIPLQRLLRYNLVDALATWYVYDKYVPIMQQDNQETVYRNILLPTLIDNIQIMLTGIILDPIRVQEVKKILLNKMNNSLATLNKNAAIIDLVQMLNEEWVDKRNATLKVKRVTLADAKEEFNPNSSAQLIKLLYGIHELPVIETTDSGLPATDKDTLHALKNHTSSPVILEVLTELANYGECSKILTTFITAFEEAVCAEDGNTYLYGNFNLGSTKSGRLSSNDPNLQNLPSNSVYGKLIKSCFVSTSDWVFCGLDFASLEDKISALTTRDTNKLAVYLDHYDGHCLRTLAYSDETELLDVKEELSLVTEGMKYYRVIHTNGSCTYHTENTLPKP